jgi:hypothetical protein
VDFGVEIHDLPATGKFECAAIMEHNLQHASAALNTRFDGGHRYSLASRDLLQGQAIEVREDDRVAIDFGQGLDHGPQEASKPCLGRGLFVVSRDLLRQFFVWSARTKTIDDGVSSHLVQPGGYLGRFSQTIITAKDLYEHVVKYVLCQILTANALLDKRKELRPILPINLFGVLHGLISSRPAKR